MAPESMSQEPEAEAGAGPEPEPATGAESEPEVEAGAGPEPEPATGAEPQPQPQPQKVLDQPPKLTSTSLTERPESSPEERHVADGVLFERAVKKTPDRATMTDMLKYAKKLRIPSKQLKEIMNMGSGGACRCRSDRLSSVEEARKKMLELIYEYQREVQQRSARERAAEVQRRERRSLWLASTAAAGDEASGVDLQVPIHLRSLRAKGRSADAAVALPYRPDKKTVASNVPSKGKRGRKKTVRVKLTAMHEDADNYHSHRLSVGSSNASMDAAESADSWSTQDVGVGDEYVVEAINFWKVQIYNMKRERRAECVSCIGFLPAVFLLGMVMTFFPSSTMLLKQREAIVDVLLDEEFSNYVQEPDSSELTFKKSYYDVMSVEEMWQWAHGPLLQFAIDEEEASPHSRGNVLLQNKLVGKMLLRQVRVKPWDCAVSHLGQDSEKKPGCPVGETCRVAPVSDKFEQLTAPGTQCFPHYLGGSCCPEAWEFNTAYSDPTNYRQLEDGGNLPSLVAAVEAGQCEPCETDPITGEISSGCDFGAGTCSRGDTFVMGREGSGWSQVAAADRQAKEPLLRASGGGNVSEDSTGNENRTNLGDANEWEQAMNASGCSLDIEVPGGVADGRLRYRNFKSVLKESPLLVDNLIPLNLINPNTMGSGGFGLELPRSSTCASMVLQRLEELTFVDLATRMVVFDFNLYNRNIDLYTTVRVSFAFDATGHVEKYARVDAIRVARRFLYAGLSAKGQPLAGGSSDFSLMQWPYFASVVLDLFLLMTFYQIWIQFRRLVRSPRHYLSNGWNVYDIIYGATVTLFIVDCMTFQQCSLDFEKDLGVRNDENHYAFGAPSSGIDGQNATAIAELGYVDSNKLRSNFRDVRQTLAWTVGLYVMRLFKYMRLSRQLSAVFSVIHIAIDELKGFVFVLFVIYCCFGLFGIAMFGNTTREFHNVPSALMTLLRFTIGDFGTVDYEQLKYNGNITAPLYIISFMILIVFVVVNMFIAIIMDAYEDEKSRRRWWHDQRSFILKNPVTHLSLFSLWHDLCRFCSPRWRMEAFDAEPEVDQTGRRISKESTVNGVETDASEAEPEECDEDAQDEDWTKFGPVVTASGSVIRIHYSRIFLGYRDQMLPDIEACDWRSQVARHLTKLKLAEEAAYRKHAEHHRHDDLVTLRGLLGNAEFVSQNAVRTHLLDNLRPGEECDLEEEHNAVGNYLTLEFKGHHVEKFEFEVEVDKQVRSRHDSGSPRASTFRVRDCYADFRVQKVVGRRPVGEFGSELQRSKSVVIGNIGDLFPGLKSVRLSLKEDLSIPIGLGFRLWWRALVYGPISAGHRGMVAEGVNKCKIFQCCSGGGVCREKSCCIHARRNVDDAAENIRDLLSPNARRQDERADKRGRRLAKEAVNRYMRAQCETIVQMSELDAKQLDPKHMHRMFIQHPTMTMALDELPGHVLVNMEKWMMERSRRHICHVLLTMVCHPEKAFKRLHTICGGYDAGVLHHGQLTEEQIRECIVREYELAVELKYCEEMSSRSDNLEGGFGPRQWNCEHVVAWLLSSHGPARMRLGDRVEDVAERVRVEKIDGETLLGYTREVLKSELELPAGQATKLYTAIGSLREHGPKIKHTVGSISATAHSAKRWAAQLRLKQKRKAAENGPDAAASNQANDEIDEEQPTLVSVSIKKLATSGAEAGEARQEETVPLRDMT